MAKYMLIMRGTDESVAKMMETPFEQMLETVGRFNEETIRAGVLVAAEGLDDPAQGVVVEFSGETPVVTDGPYGETKELFGGFYVIDVASKEEAVEWAKRLPAVAGTKCEIRRVPSIDEFPQDQGLPSSPTTQPVKGGRNDKEDHVHNMQNSEFLTWAAMYKNTAGPTVRRTLAAHCYAVNDVLSS